YGEAIDRERGVRQLDFRVLLGQVRLKIGDADEAMRQAGLVLAVDKKRTDATILQARALAESGATPSDRAARRQDAPTPLRPPARQGDPHGAGRLSGPGGDPPEGRRAGPGRHDPEGGAARESGRRRAAGQLVQLLSERGPDGQPLATADVAEARRIADEIAAR